MTRTRGLLVAVLVCSAFLTLLTATASEARRNRERLEVGSILVEVTSGTPDALAGLAILANQGIYPFPKLTATDSSVTVPFFAIKVDIDDDGIEPTIREFDSFVAMTNTNSASGGKLTVKVTFRRADGSLVTPTAKGQGNPMTVTLMPGQTAVVSAASALNP